MSWIDDLNARQDVGQITRYQPVARQIVAPQQDKKKKGGRGGFLTSLISEGGALGGGAQGAVLGSALGPVGTLVGGALGAGIGAFGGRLLENKVRDNRLGIGDAAKEGALSAAFGASPIKLGKAAFGAKKAGTTIAEALKGGAASTVTKTAEKAAPEARTSLSGRLNELADKALTSQYGTISKPVARATNPEKTFRKLSELGITKPSDVERISNAITGTNGILNKAVVKATGNSNRVDVSNLRQVLTDALENNGVVDTKAKELTTMFDAQMKRMLGGPRGSLVTTAHPSDVLDVMKAFEKRIAQKTGKGSNYRLATDETVNQANALRLVNDELQSRLESGANIKNVLTPELRDKLIGLYPNNAQWQKYVDNTVMKAGSIKNLRSAQAPFVNAGKIINEADLNKMTFGGRVGNSANTIREALLNAVVTPFKAPAYRAASTTLRTAGNIADKAPTLAVPNIAAPNSLQQGLRSGARSQVGEGLLSQLLGAGQNQSMMSIPRDNLEQNPQINQDSNTIPTNGQLNPQTNQATATTQMNNFMDTSYTNNGNLSSPQFANDVFDPANIQQNVAKLVANGATTKDVTEYVSLVKTLSDINGTKNKPLNTTAAGVVADTQTGLRALDELSGSIAQNSANSPILGGLRSLNPYDTKAQSLQAQVATAKQIVGKALEGGVLRKEDEVKYAKLLPTMRDTDETAQFKIQQLQSLISARLRDYINSIGAGDGSPDQSTIASSLGL